MERKLIQLFGNLISSGFNLTEMVDFLQRSHLLQDSYIQQMRAGLLGGLSFSKMMAQVGCSDNVVTQLSLAELHGDLPTSLAKIESYLTNLLAVKKKLIEVAIYPVMLLSFLLLIMLGLKNYLLPQLEEGNWASQLISCFPTFFLLGALALLLIALLLTYLARRMEAIKLMSILSRLPLIGTYIRLYQTAYYAREWGNLLGQGIEMAQIVSLMQSQQSRLFSALGYDMEKALLAGREFHEQVRHYPFFLKELSLIIEYGQVKSKLGSELAIYAQESWELFFSKINKATQLIQPLIFILVALVIVMIYAAMLLPIYQNMEVNL